MPGVVTRSAAKQQGTPTTSSPNLGAAQPEAVRPNKRPFTPEALRLANNKQSPGEDSTQTRSPVATSPSSSTSSSNEHAFAATGEPPVKRRKILVGGKVQSAAILLAVATAGVAHHEGRLPAVASVPQWCSFSMEAVRTRLHLEAPEPLPVPKRTRRQMPTKSETKPAPLFDSMSQFWASAPVMEPPKKKKREAFVVGYGIFATDDQGHVVLASDPVATTPQEISPDWSQPMREWVDRSMKLGDEARAQMESKVEAVTAAAQESAHQASEYLQSMAHETFHFVETTLPEWTTPNPEPAPVPKKKRGWLGKLKQSVTNVIKDASFNNLYDK